MINNGLGEYIKGCINLGVQEEQAGNKSIAKTLYKKACGAGNMLGCLNQGSLEWQAGNKSVAEKLRKKACDGGYKKACK